MNREKLEKANKATRLIVCLQNRVRDIIYQKLQQKENDFISLKEDLQDVTESHNLKVIQLQETFEQ